MFVSELLIGLKLSATRPSQLSCQLSVLDLFIMMYRYKFEIVSIDIFNLYGIYIYIYFLWKYKGLSN